MKEVRIDCRSILNRDAFHDILAAALQFPDYYGKNLDALYDCLTELSDQHLVLEHFSHLEEALGDYAHSIRQTLQEAENDSFNLCVTFC